MRPDIRRRLRESRNTAEYTLVVLFDALRARKRTLRGSTIALFGFPKKKDDESPPARAIREGLANQGAHVRIFEPREHADVTPRALDDALLGVSGAIIASDARVFRLVSRKDFRSRGVDIVVPTNIREAL